MYDFIGDIHGHADELVALLDLLGYHKQSGVYRHPKRQAVFCGDFVDRGEKIPQVVDIVRAMVESGAAQAVMGNHELNALAFHTESPCAAGTWLRPHTSRNIQQHQQTLDQFSHADLNSALDWFRTLPVALDLEDCRVVHACWSDPHLQQVEASVESLGAFSPEFLAAATKVGDPLFDAIECVMKGPELPLPEGLKVVDKEGNARRRIRIRWFEAPDNHTWASYALPEAPQLPKTPVPVDAPACPYPKTAPPVFVGHYWLPSESTKPLTPNVACLDLSVARGGCLCAYRFNGVTLSTEHFVTIPAIN